MLVFVISINVSPSLAAALDKWVEYVDFDRAFNNIVSSGNIQEKNITVEEDKALNQAEIEITGDYDENHTYHL